MRHLFLSILFAAAACAQAAEVSPFEEIAYRDAATGFRFAQMLATYRFQRTQEYGGARGYSVEYLENTGGTASIEVYDLGQQGIPDGIADSRVREEFRKIDASIAALVQKGRYKSATHIEKQQPLSKEWLQTSHAMLLPGGKTVHSYAFIRGQRGKFVKIQVTGAPDGTYARLHPFLLSVMRATGLMIPGYQPPRVMN